MFPAIFAVLLLGHFVAAEIYVGQNPQNVNAVIKDANGNLVPVTGVADEIVVVDLNYGGEGNSSGMSVDVSVTPVNGSSSSGMGYPPLEYPSSISLPAGSPSSQISNPPLSASPVSLPSASEAPASAAASNLSSISGLGSASGSASGFGSASGATASGASGLGMGLNIPTLPPLGPGSSAAPSIPSEPPSKSPVSEFDNLVSNLSGASGTKTGVPSSVSKSNMYYYPTPSYPHNIKARSAQYDEYPRNSAPATSFASQNFINSYPSAFPFSGYVSNPNQLSNIYPTNIEQASFEQTSFAHPPNTWASGYLNPSLSGWPVQGAEVVSSPELDFDLPTPASAPWPSALSDYNSSPGGYPETYVPPPSPPVIEYSETYFPPPSRPLSEPPISPAIAESIVDSLIPASIIIPVFPQNGEENYNYTIAGNGAISNTVIPTSNSPYTPSHPQTFTTPTPISSSSSLPIQVTQTTGNLFTFYNPFTTQKPPNTFTLSHTHSTLPPITFTTTTTTIPTNSGYYTSGTGETTSSGYTTGAEEPTSSGYTTGSGSSSGISGSGSGSMTYNTFSTPQVIITPLETTTHKIKTTTKETSVTTAFGGTASGIGSQTIKTTHHESSNPFSFSETTKKPHSESSNNFNFFTPPTFQNPVTTSFGGTATETGSTGSSLTTAFGGTASGIGSQTTKTTHHESSNPFSFSETTKKPHSESSNIFNFFTPPTFQNPVTTSFGGTATETGSTSSLVTTAFGGTASGIGSQTTKKNHHESSNPFSFSETTKKPHSESSNIFNFFTPPTFQNPVTTSFGGTATETGSTGSSVTTAFGGTASGIGSQTTKKSHHESSNPFSFSETTKKPHSESSNIFNFFTQPTFQKHVTTAFGGTATGTGSETTKSNFLNFFTPPSPQKHVTTSFESTATGTGSETTKSNFLNFFTPPSPQKHVTTSFGSTATGTGSETTKSNFLNFFTPPSPQKHVTTAFGGTATGTGSETTKSNFLNFFTPPSPQKHVTTFGSTAMETGSETTKSNFLNFFTPPSPQKHVTTAFGGTATGTGSETTKSNFLNFFTPPSPQKHVTTSFGNTATGTGSETTESNFLNFFTPPSPQKHVTTSFGSTATGTGSETTKSGSSKSSKGESSLFNLFTLPTTPKSVSNPSITSSALGDNGLGTGASFETASGSASGTGSGEKPKKSSSEFGGFNLFGNSKSNTATAGSQNSEEKPNTLFNFFSPQSNTKSESTSKPSFSNPFSQSNGSQNKNSNGPSLFSNPFAAASNPFAGLFGGGAQNKPKKSTGPAPSLFVELGGSLGPVVDPVNLTPVDMSNPFVSNVTSSTKQNKNKNNPFFNMTNMMMNLSSPFQFPPNTNATPLNGILGSLFNSSAVKMQPVNSNTAPLSGLINSFMGGSQSTSNPGKSNASPFGSLMNSFMNPSTLLSPFGGSSSSSFNDMLDSFMNSSSLFNSSSADSSLDDMMNSFFPTNPSLSNQTDGSLSPLTDIMNSIMNTTSSLLNTNSSTTSPFGDMMNSFSSTNGSPFSGLSDLFSPNGNGFLSSFMDTMTNPTDASSISNLMSPFLGGNSSIFNLSSPSMPSDSTNLKGMLQSFLPPGMFGESDSDSGSDSDSDDEDYFDPLSSLLPPKKSSSIPSLSGTSASGLTSSDGQLLEGIGNMENNLFTQTATGKTPLTSLLNSVFGANGAAPPSISPFALGGLLNPMSFMNGSSFNLTTAFKNRTPLSGLQNIISSLNSTGLFGDLSPLLTVAQNLTSIVTQSMNNKTKGPDNFDDILSNIMSLWQDIMPIMQTFMKNFASKQATINTGPQPIPLMHSSPSAFMPMPLGFGSSFLVLPTAPTDQNNSTVTGALAETAANNTNGTETSPLPSLSGTSASGIISSDGPLLDGLENMENNLLSPTATGKTPLTSLLDSVFGVNGSSPPSTSPFALGGLLNPMSFVNGSSLNLTSAFQNHQPFSGFQTIISSLNSTGLFGDLTPLSIVAQNLTSIVTQDMNNGTKNINFSDIMSNIMTLWKDIIPILQTFMKKMANNPLMHAAPSVPMPIPMLRGFGSSFLVLPTSSEPLQSSDVQASAAAPEPESEPKPSPAETPTSAPVSSGTSISPQPTTDQNNSTDNGASATTPSTNTNGTKTSPSAGGINLSSIWITLVGCLFVAFSQKSFLGLM